MAEGAAVMREGEARSDRAGLTYPFEALPKPGDAIVVADGVLWLRFPLPMALDHINLWALRDGEGWAIVDTGLDFPASREAWEVALSGPLEGRPITQVICTHMHPDHVGLAGWLCARFDVPLKMSRLEYVTLRMLMADTGPAPESGAQFYRACGWSGDQVEDWRGRFGQFAKAVSEPPAAYHRLTAGEILLIDGRAWKLVGGDGHSPEHICLLREDDDVFIAGDQVLPRISSNVSVWPTEPEADPLADWLTSLDRLEREVPDRVLVLPSHGEPFRGLHARLQALRRGHETALTRLVRRLSEPRRAVDVFGTLFARPISAGLLSMATGESVAHLTCLVRQGRAIRETDAEGVWRWRAV
ncbi:MBL fold metallo-hydrolase [Brevundimonas aveniformis]|uniref:MBL fold metallo-hydrolase n=1 Tax=Brevundimonas aveniformis TaxID=370977 RepID=UPI000403B573